MMYADSITKSFLNAGSIKGNAPLGQLDDYQDPTYIGFQLRLIPSINAQTDLSDLPHGLFTLDPVKDPYSCYNYLLSRGETKRAQYIILFEKYFQKIINSYPWYFTKITGLAESWKIDTKNNYRGKEKKLTIETLESIDMRMTLIMDLYRKAVWDSAYMRWAVPDHMRFFRMEVIVSEIRPMKISSQGYENSGPSVGVINSAGTNFETTIAGMNAKNPGIGLWDTSAPWSSGTFIAFRYSECELDVFNEAPAFLDNIGSTPEAPATNKIIINTHVIEEKNVYGLLGAILDDTKLYTDYTASNSDDRGGTKFPANPEGLPINSSLQNVAAGPSIYRYEDGYSLRKKEQNNLNAEAERRRSVTGAGITGGNTAGNTGRNNVIGSIGKAVGGALRLGAEALATGAEAAARDFARSASNKTLLGNVYGISPLSLIGSAQSILNNPAAAVEAILRKHSSPSIGTNLARNVQLTGEEIELVKTILGSSVTEAEDSIKVNPDLTRNQGKADLSSVSINPANPGKANLTAANINLDNPGKANLTAPNINLDNLGKGDLSGADILLNNPGKTNLTAANINLDNPGKVNLRAPVNKSSGAQKTNLTAFASAGSISGKVELEGPTVLPPTAQQEELIEPIIPRVTLGNADLQGAPVEKTNLGKTDFN